MAGPQGRHATARSGCFSFQASKNLNSGEGGAILTSDDALIETCYRFHNNSRGRRNTGNDFSYRQHGREPAHDRVPGGAADGADDAARGAGADARDERRPISPSLLKQIPGITPARMYDGCTRNAYHLYMFRYDPAAFAGLSRAAFLKALDAEGVPASSGYSPLNKEPFLEDALAQPRLPGDLLEGRAWIGWRERNRCPQNDRLCSEAVWLGRRCCSARARTWRTSPRRCGRCRPMRRARTAPAPDSRHVS